MTEWKEVAGEGDWNGLLKPLNGKLRQRIVQCGKRVQTIYDSINTDGLPRYDKANLFSNVGPEKDKPTKLYEVKEYIYAWVDVSANAELVLKDKSVWMGYVAVSTEEGKNVLGRRDILICWRGTLQTSEWERNFAFSQTLDTKIFPNVRHSYVHKGFYSLYTSSNPTSDYNKTSARDQALKAVRDQVDQYKDEEISITVTGHSLGAAIATMNAADIVSNGYNSPKQLPNKDSTVTAFVFASPKVGNNGFRFEFDQLRNRHLHLLHTKHVDDFIPKVPVFSYVAVGFELKIQTTNSTSKDYKKLPFPGMLSKVHSLENYLSEVERRQEKSAPADIPLFLAFKEREDGDLELCEVTSHPTQ